MSEASSYLQNKWMNSYPKHVYQIWIFLKGIYDIIQRDLFKAQLN